MQCCCCRDAERDPLDAHRASRANRPDGARLPKLKVEVERHGHRSRTDGSLPVVRHGTPIDGWVQLASPSASLDLAVTAVVRKVLSSGVVVDERSTSAVRLRLRKPNLSKVRFTLATAQLPTVPSYSGGHFRIEHLIRAETVGTKPRAKAEHAFVLRVLSPVPPARAAWMTVADFGGECRLELNAGGTVDLREPTLEGRLYLRGLPKLARATLKLLAIEDGEEHECYELNLLPDAPTLTTGAACKRDFSLPLHNADGEPLFSPDVPLDSARPPMGVVEHCLRLVIEPLIEEAAAWNSLPMKLVHGDQQAQSNAVPNMAAIV
ncbi:hypothetical protein AB1Y20_015669 [Prymnesium parvum]|uniref:Arrestin-like N-terminal domain-containing protein n=1 Tax=Prymnesium parvum TaxID=97485 RepID=A0AB34JYJ6_PRYPA